MRKMSFGLLAGIFFVAGCATVPITGRRQLSLIPASTLLSVSVQSYDQLLKESKLSSDAQNTALVRAVGRNIGAAAEQFLRDNGLEGEIKNYQWDFNLIEDPKTVNAFCMPGGKVAVYTGILPLTQDANGLAVVVGHEVAHAIANHGNERMSQMLLVQLGGMTLEQALSEKPQQTQQLWMAAYGLGANVGILLPYSRGNELEADHIGLVLMARAGYDPGTAIPFWERMNAAGGAAPPEFLSTHPAPATRINDMKKYLPEAMKYYKK